MKKVLIFVSISLVGCSSQIGTTPQGIQYATEACSSHGGINTVSEFQHTVATNGFIQATCMDGFVFNIFHKMKE